jgi:uracil-DNA glycosylase family 4
LFHHERLKCRPPENRNPHDAEILACLPLLEKQIVIIAPKALLLLGRIAAHALLGVPESITKLRAQTVAYKGIAAFVTYHPAAILRNAEYRKPAEEDLQKVLLHLNKNG